MIEKFVALPLNELQKIKMVICLEFWKIQLGVDRSGEVVCTICFICLCLLEL